jgi:predicted HTH transcriptional regulator
MERSFRRRCLAIKVEREKNALASLSELAIKILDYVRNHGRVTSRDMVRETGASPNTLKATFSNLVEKRLLVRHGGGRSTVVRPFLIKVTAQGSEPSWKSHPQEALGVPS